MSKDISLILASPESLVAIVKAGRQGPAAIPQVIDDSVKDNDDFADYLEELCQEYDFTQTNNFYSEAGYYATWALASYRPSWYLRNVSVSLFLDNSDFDRVRYISTPDLSSLGSIVAYDHFPDGNYCLGGVITPQNARNFIEDYRSDPEFKSKVDDYFGIFVWGLFDALGTATQQNTCLLESTDLFGIDIPSDSSALSFIDMAVYSSNAYEMTGLALQGYSAKAQMYLAQAKKCEENGDTERAGQYRQARNELIEMMTRNASKYASRVQEASGVELPTPDEHYWN